MALSTLSVSKKHITVFGEMMLRLDAPANHRFIQADSFIARYTGAEANVAVALAQIGIRSSVVTRVPDQELGHACANALRKYGVDTQFIVKGGNRLGILYVENGASQRASRIIYDRAHSSFAQLKPAEFAWPKILKGSDWLHLTGITPALGEGPRVAQLDAIRTAQKRRMKISYDCNYRSTLWSVESAHKVLPKMIEGIDLFLGTPHDARMLFGIEGDPAACAVALQKKFGIRHVALTMRQMKNFSVNHMEALIAGPKGVLKSRAYEIHILDRIGAGDAFAAGIIYGLLAGWPDQRTVEFGLASCVLKQSIPGDFGLSTLDEIEDLARTGQSARLRR
jgi:2-dehydro-3-deoxygluconokinase